MKIIGICGSRRKGGNSEILLKTALSKSKEKGVEVEFIALYDKSIKFCDGCCECDTTKKCHIQDDMDNIIKKLKEADGIIFATPTYFDDVNGSMKNFLDRLNPVGVDRELKNKKVGIIAVGGTEPKSFKRAIKTIEIFSKIELMKVVASMWAKAYKREEVRRNSKVMKEAENLGSKIAKVLHL
jgi:multimeric flavodoxin WrbA